MSILDEIVAATRIRVAHDKRDQPQLTPAVRPPFAFEQALRGSELSFICEVKQASPSKGVIVPNFDPVRIAREYEAAGAQAISVLTEPDFFAGSDRDLAEVRAATTLPILRKDFVIDPYQITQAAALGADAVLLICAVLSDAQLRDFLAQTNELGLTALVETHDSQEVARAQAAGARVIGVNNRDLRTFRVDPTRSVQLRSSVGPDVVFVSESGIVSAADTAALRAGGVDAVLVGEALLRRSDKRVALAELRGGGTA